MSDESTINRVSQTRFWVGTRVSQTRVSSSKNSPTYKYVSSSCYAAKKFLKSYYLENFAGGAIYIGEALPNFVNFLNIYIYKSLAPNMFASIF